MTVSVAEQTQLMTAEEFWPLSQGPDFRGELIEGEIREMVAPGWKHGVIESKIAHLLISFANPRELGVVSTECGFILSRNPDTILAPDVSFVAAQRLPGEITEKFPEFCPDLAVEVVSPNDAYSEVQDKAERYLATGVNEVWIVDPRHRRVTILRRPHEWITLGEEDNLETPLLPGFKSPVREVFA